MSVRAQGEARVASKVWPCHVHGMWLMRLLACLLSHLQADKYGVPRVENTNVDRSVGLMHIALMGCARG